jgi:hypothetical protein
MFKQKQDMIYDIYEHQHVKYEFKQRRYALVPFPTHEGREKIAAYYHEKYHIDIKALNSLDDLMKEIQYSEESPEDHCRGFIIDISGGANLHIIPIIYEKHDGISSLFVLESLGYSGISVYLKDSSTQQVSSDILYLKTHYFSTCQKMPQIYANETSYQADSVSCAVSAFVLLKDILRDKLHNKDQRIIDFILSSHPHPEDETIHLFKLPPQWFRCNQLSKNIRGIDSEQIILSGNKEKTLSEHLNQYSRTLSLYGFFTAEFSPFAKVRSETSPPDISRQVNVYLKDKAYRYCNKIQ